MSFFLDFLHIISSFFFIFYSKLLLYSVLRVLVTFKQMWLVLMTLGVHPFPFRTRKLSPIVPKILSWRRLGKIGQRQLFLFYYEVYNMKDLLSIIIPSYNEADNIENTTTTVLKIMDEAHIPCEVVFVSDGSTDDTFAKILDFSRIDNRVKGIEFSRNFGKEAAIIAGLEKGSGDCFVVMDCDLQHPPETIVKMYNLWKDGYDIIEGIKKERGKEFFLHRKFVELFYSVISNLTGFDMKNTSDFKLFDKKVADVLLSMPERKTFFRALTFWTGFKSCKLEYSMKKRSFGKSKWSVKSLVKYAISNFVSFSSMPLNIVTYLGIVSLFITFVLGIQTFVRWLIGHAVEGFTTVILLLLFFGSTILIGLGLIGRYIAAIYEEIKQRPRYIVKYDTSNLSDEEQ